jgi:hypothetical protein
MSEVPGKESPELLNKEGLRPESENHPIMERMEEVSEPDDDPT